MVIRFPNKFTLGFIIVILVAIQLISFIVFSIQIQAVIDSSTEVEKKLTLMDQALNNHNDNFDVYLEKKSGKKYFFSLHLKIDKFNQLSLIPKVMLNMNLILLVFYRCAGEETYQFGPKTQKFDTKVQKL